MTGLRVEGSALRRLTVVIEHEHHDTVQVHRSVLPPLCMTKTSEVLQMR